MDAHTPSKRSLSRRDLLKWGGAGLAAAASAPAIWTPARALAPKRGGTISLRRSGTSVPKPAIRIPTLAKFAKPHRA